MFTSIQGLPLSDILTGQGFRVDKAQEQPERGVRVDFSCVAVGKPFRVGSIQFPNKIASGFLVLDADWTLKSFECMTQGQPGFTGKMSGSIKVVKEASGLRADHHFVDEFNYADGKKRTDRTDGSVAFQQRSLSDKDFTLGAFGLVEPQWGDTEPTPWWLWAAAATVVSALVFFVLKRLAMRAAG